MQSHQRSLLYFEFDVLSVLKNYDKVLTLDLETIKKILLQLDASNAEWMSELDEVLNKGELKIQRWALMGLHALAFNFACSLTMTLVLISVYHLQLYHSHHYSLLTLAATAAALPQSQSVGCADAQSHGHVVPEPATARHDRRVQPDGYRHRLPSDSVWRYQVSS